MKEIANNKDLVAYCGLYCGSCGAYRRDKCKGCHNNRKATWCKIRTCCMENGYLSCADCSTYPDVQQCSYFNNFMSKFFAFIFKSDRKACIEQIRLKGVELHASEMSSKGLQCIKKT